MRNADPDAAHLRRGSHVGCTDDALDRLGNQLRPPNYYWDTIENYLVQVGTEPARPDRPGHLHAHPIAGASAQDARGVLENAGSMKAPAFARIFGVLFLFIGALGFAPWATAPAPLSAEYINLGSYYGLVFGIFAVNGVQDLVHILIGGWACSRRSDSDRR